MDIKPATRINRDQARQYLLGCFDGQKPLRDFTTGDAENFRLHLIGQGKATNTVRRANWTGKAVFPRSYAA